MKTTEDFIGSSFKFADPIVQKKFLLNNQYTD